MTYVAADDRYEHMTYRRCGRSGLDLPAVSLGLWHNFGHDRAGHERGHRAAGVRSRYHPLRPRERLRPALRLGRGELRPPARPRPGAVPGRARDLDEGGLRHVARALRRPRLAQVSAGEPRPEPAP